MNKRLVVLIGASAALAGCNSVTVRHAPPQHPVEVRHVHSHHPRPVPPVAIVQQRLPVGAAVVIRDERPPLPQHPAPPRGHHSEPERASPAPRPHPATVPRHEAPARIAPAHRPPLPDKRPDAAAARGQDRSHPARRSPAPTAPEPQPQARLERKPPAVARAAVKKAPAPVDAVAAEQWQPPASPERGAARPHGPAERIAGAARTDKFPLR